MWWFLTGAELTGAGRLPGATADLLTEFHPGDGDEWCVPPARPASIACAAPGSAAAVRGVPDRRSAYADPPRRAYDRTIFPRLALAAAAAAAVTLSGCGSSPPQAKTLTGKITGCGKDPGSPPAVNVHARYETSCMLADGATVVVATFAGNADERAWITGQGEFGGCCLEGKLWAATVDTTGSSQVYPMRDWRGSARRSAAARCPIPADRRAAMLLGRRARRASPW